jgi:uncharacterized protein YkwD
MKKLLLLLLLLPFCSLTQINNESLNKEFVVKLNEYRKQNGLDPVVLDDKSIYRAKLQSEYCVKEGVLTHDCPKWFPYRWAECGLWNMYVPDATRCLEEWIDSPNHNDLLLLDGATKIGIYAAEGDYENEEGCYVFLVLN